MESWLAGIHSSLVGFDALQRARALVTRLEEDPNMNPSTETMEFSLRDPDGYHVTISSLQGILNGAAEDSER